MTSYWLCVTNEENWEVVKERKVWGVSELNKGKIEGVKLGDVLVFYLKPKRVAGIFKTVSEPFKGEEEVFSSVGFADEEIFPYRVKLEPVTIPQEPIPFEKLIPELKFIGNKEKWAVYLRTAMRVIPKEDFELMVSSMER